MLEKNRNTTSDFKIYEEFDFLFESQWYECAQLMLPIILPIESVWVRFVETMFDLSNLNV